MACKVNSRAGRATKLQEIGLRRQKRFKRQLKPWQEKAIRGFHASQSAKSTKIDALESTKNLDMKQGNCWLCWLIILVVLCCFIFCSTNGKEPVSWGVDPTLTGRQAPFKRCTETLLGGFPFEELPPSGRNRCRVESSAKNAEALIFQHCWCKTCGTFWRMMAI